MDTRRMTLCEWEAEGQALFGEDKLLWRFVCPVCGHAQRPIDFLPHKDRGAKPDSAHQECIGRYTGGRSAFYADPGAGPCDYAGYGLFRLSPIVVVLDDGKEVMAFDFSRESA